MSQSFESEAENSQVEESGLVEVLAAIDLVGL